MVRWPSPPERLQALLKAFKTGLTVTGLTLQDARPPEEVKPAFDEVNGAQQVKERLINEAQAYAAKVVPEARGRPRAPVPLPKATSEPWCPRPKVTRSASACCRPSTGRSGSDPQAPVAGDRAAGAEREPQ